MHFSYTINNIDSLENSISTNRLSAYLLKSLSDKEKALKLYAWNTAISSELYSPLQGLEITLRNAIHRELSKKYSENWFDNTDIPLIHITKNKVQFAKDSLNRQNKYLHPSNIISELSFGFWVTLTGSGEKGSYHDKLWTPAINKSFPNIKKKRTEIHKELGYLLKLRNRIAHHEPIFGRHLQRDYERVIEVIGWICPDTASWVEHHNLFDEVMSKKP